MKVLLPVAVTSAIVGCGAESPNEPPVLEVETLPALPRGFASMTDLAVLPGSRALYRAASLCEVMKTYSDAGGVFVVEALRSSVEDDAPTGRRGVPFTYVVLRAESEWRTSSSQRLVVRQSGGALGDGIVSATVPLAVGETLVAFLRLRENENEGYYQFLEPSVFRMSDAGLTHSQWFRGERVSADDIRVYFDANTKPSVACRRNVEPSGPAHHGEATAEPDGPLIPLPEGAE